MKKLFLFAILIAAVVFFIRFLTPEDTWIRVNNQWVQHGNPATLKPEDNQIKKFGSVEELRAFLEENQNVEQGGIGGGGEMAVMRDFGANLKTEAVPAAAGAEKPDYSKTNVQVEGVDEADIVKTDGKYIYAVSQNNLFIIDATPAENSSILAKIEFKSTPSEIYINGSSLVVYGYNQQVYDASWYKKFKRQSPYTFFKVFDVADHKNPRQVRDLDFEGSVTASRMIGDYVYLITNYSQYGVFDTVPYPRILNSVNGEMMTKTIPDIFYFDFPYDSFNFVSVAAINVKNNNQEIKSSAYLLPQAQNIYVSQKNIYITYTRYMSEQELTAAVMREIIYPKLSAKEKQRIDAIESSPSYVLSSTEKLQKISQLMQMYLTFLSSDEQERLQKQVEDKLKQKYQDLSKELEKTVIHKIAINNARLDYKNYGEVTGSVLNQFSMDESVAGDFRIATTKNRSWSRFEENVNSNKSYNNLYVLDTSMNTIGKLEDLAFDERIYSVRFMGARAYMVTFKQTDPLFVIDVKNPRAPRVLGKLKVPGFSQYLHLYDENTLIGFGKETDDQGVVTSLKLSLFDVSNVDNLKEIDKVTLGERGSNSVALYDHKAFLFSKDKNLLVVPVEIKENENTPVYIESEACAGGRCLVSPQQAFHYFRGAMVYEITKNGFKLKGKIDHADSTEVSSGDWWGYGGYDTTVKRSLYIGDVLYTLSDKYVKAHRISDLTLVKNLELKKEQKEDFKIVN